MFPSWSASPAIPGIGLAGRGRRRTRRGRAKLPRDRRSAARAGNRARSRPSTPPASARTTISRERPLPEAVRDAFRRIGWRNAARPLAEASARGVDHRDFGAGADRKAGEMRREREVEIVAVEAVERLLRRTERPRPPRAWQRRTCRRDPACPRSAGRRPRTRRRRSAARRGAGCASQPCRNGCPAAGQ